MRPSPTLERSVAGSIALVVACMVIACGCAGHERVVAPPKAQAPATPVGEVVTGAGSEFRTVFQSSDGTYWFGSRDRGLFRMRDGVVTRFTTAHGLPGDGVRGIAEDRAGNIIVVSEPGGLARFDGRTFQALQPAATRSDWRLHSDDLWFPAGPDTGAVLRYDGTTVHRLTLPKTEAGEAWIARYPRATHPGIKYSPYDVYTIYRDSRGHLWFGTALLGACRYDGTNFEWIANEIGFGETNSFGLRSIIESRPGVFWFCHPPDAVEIPAVAQSAPGFQRSAGGMPFRKVPGFGTSSDPFSTFTASATAPNGDLWLLILGGGAWRFDGRRMAHFPVLRDGHPIWANSIALDRQGVPWVGTDEHGVYRFNGTEFVRWMP